MNPTREEKSWQKWSAGYPFRGEGLILRGGGKITVRLLEDLLGIRRA